MNLTRRRGGPPRAAPADRDRAARRAPGGALRRGASRCSRRRSRSAAWRPRCSTGCPGGRCPLVVYGDGAEDAAAAAGRLGASATATCRCWRAGWPAGWPAAASSSATSTRPARRSASWSRPRRAPPPWPPASCAPCSRSGADVVVVDARRFEEYHDDEHPDRDQRARRRAGHAGRCARPRPGHPGRGELRRADPEHHRDAVTDQRRAAEPGGGAAQRDHRLEPGRAGPGPRPAAPGPRGAAGHGPAGGGGGLGRRPARPGRAGSAPPRWRRCWTAGRGPSTGSTSAPPRTTRRVTWPGSGLLPAGSWCRRPTGTPRSGEPSWCWPTTVAAGPR